MQKTAKGLTDERGRTRKNVGGYGGHFRAVQGFKYIGRIDTTDNKKSIQ